MFRTMVCGLFYSRNMQVVVPNSQVYTNAIQKLYALLLPGIMIINWSLSALLSGVIIPCIILHNIIDKWTPPRYYILVMLMISITMVLATTRMVVDGLSNIQDFTELWTYTTLRSSTETLLRETHWSLSTVYGIILPLPLMLVESKMFAH